MTRRSLRAQEEPAEEGEEEEAGEAQEEKRQRRRCLGRRRARLLQDPGGRKRSLPRSTWAEQVEGEAAAGEVVLPVVEEGEGEVVMEGRRAEEDTRKVAEEVTRREEEVTRKVQ